MTGRIHTMDEAARETVTGVAMLFDDGRMIALTAPHRHHHLYSLAAFAEIDADGGPDTQGFTTSLGRFVGRKEALAIAQAAGQPIRKHGRVTELYSEDLW